MTVNELRGCLDHVVGRHPEYGGIEVCSWDPEWGWMSTDPAEDVAVVRHKSLGGVFMAIGDVRTRIGHYCEVVWPEDRDE